MALREELLAVVEVLLSTRANPISLNAIGEAVGSLAVTPPELEEMFARLEQAGRTVGDNGSDPSSAFLGGVISAARELRGELGRPARLAEIAARSGLSPERVRAALLLVQVMQR